jgi:uncharacterized protein YdbL (DUF1318 family)
MLFALFACSPTHRNAFEGTPDQRSFEELKANIQGQAEKVQDLKVAGNVEEGRLGYLVGVEKVPLRLEQRQLVQQENVWREQMFELVGKRTGYTKEEVAGIFAKLVEHANEQASSKP